jgi:multicomponent Na+:H+ antiporter subunit B
MTLIYSTATRYLLPVLLIFSIYLLFRGHNEPGGGFVGGLVAAIAFTVHATAFQVKSATRMLGVQTHVLIAVGFALAVLSGLIGLTFGETFLHALWMDETVTIPVLGKLGTTFIFDLGVYFAVIGVTLTIFFTLMEE